MINSSDNVSKLSFELFPHIFTELTLSCARVPDIIAATQKLPAHLMLGMGFETKSGYYGAINQLGPDCTILKNTPLLSRNHLNK